MAAQPEVVRVSVSRLSLITCTWLEPIRFSIFYFLFSPRPNQNSRQNLNITSISLSLYVNTVLM